MLLFISIAAVSAVSEEQLTDNVTVSNQNNVVLGAAIDDMNISSSGENSFLGAPDSGDSVLGAQDAGTLANLRTKINNAPSDSEIFLENDYNFGSYSSGAGVQISKNLVIDGQGYTIDANEMGRIFYIPSIGSASKIGYNVTLKNIVFKNAKYAAAAGGAIYFGGYNLTVENCTFESNKNTFASKGGGAIYVAYRENVLVNITDTTFTKNSVQHGGGALYFDNPNNLQTDFNIYINNSDFIENSAGPSGFGGGAIINYRGANLYIDSSRFVANTANGKDGGAIRYSGTTTITNSEFYENKAEHGAAIGFGQFVDLTIKGSIFANNTAVQEGGAVKARYFTIDDVDFINNTAARGGALYSRSNVATLQNSRFTNNTASIYGGALYVNEEVNSLSVSNNDFIDNNANEGGAVYSNSKSVTTTNSNFYNNSANSGGAIYINKGEFTISGSTLENNTATIEGGAVDVRSSDGVEIKGSLLKNNSAPLGGAVYWYGNNGKIIESHFVSNNATNGSSVNWRGSSGSIEKSTFNDSNINFGSVFWHGPDGSISESTFLTPKAVYICSHGDVHFKDNTELSPESGDYIIYVANKASFDSNDFNNLIYNYGLIISPTYIVTLDNTTKISNSNSVVVYTQVLDDNNNIIELGDNIVNVYDSTNLPTTYNGTHYVSSINNLKIGEHRISSIGYNASRFTDLTVKTGGVLYLVLNLTINQTNFGEKVVINATLVNTTYNGTMDIALNDIHYNVTLTNGTAILTLYNLAPNTYDIVATYQEFNQTISTDVIISVELRNSTINITANNVYYGNITTIKVNVTNGTTGFVYLFVNNKMYTIQLVNSTGEYNLTGLAGGNYTVFGLYAGDAYFESSYNQTSFNVYKYDTPINITVKDINLGQIATIKVDFPSDINGRAYVFIEDREYVFYNRTSVTIYESNLTAGNITVRAYHDGNNKYKENTTVAYFNVTKKNMTIIVRTADVPVGENETILVVIPADAKGVVLLTVNGTNYFQYADGNLARFVISGLARGWYNVTATYAEGPIYNTANASSSFNVFYVRAFDFNVSTSVDNDLNVLVDISLPKDIDGDVYVEINGTNYTAHMSKGKGTVLIAGLSGGEYNGTVYLVNDTKYLSSNRTFTVNLERVSPNIVVDYNHTIYVDDDAIIKVTIDNDAAGNITIRINNTNYTQKIENGVANFNITGLAWNTYQFNVTYAGDRKYLPDVKEYTLEVSRIHNYYSYLEIHDIYVGENATVKVTFEDDTTGTVTLLINGSTHVIHLTNGTGTINITGLPVGKHIINATYSGDRKYEPCNRVFEDFHVKKIINYDFIPKGNTSDTHADINVTLPSDASGHVNITINGVTYTNIPVTNGFANYTVYNLESGKQYPTRIDYSGNEKYEAASRNITLNSQKTLDYEFIVEGDSIHVGDVAHIIVKLPKATDGDRVVIRVENVTNPYNTFVVNGTINQSVINLKEGEYHVTVEYEGNSEFEASAKSTYIYVSKISSFRFDVIANEPYVGENLTVDIILPDDTKGNVTVTVSINNTNYTANVTNGTAHVEIPNLPAGVYNTTVFYSGDNKYHNATKTIEVIVQKIDIYEFTVTPSDIFVGENETIRIKLPKDIDGDVTITIVNTTHVNRAVNVVNGTGWYNVTGLARGQYVAYVTLKNDSKYEEDTVFGNFKVSPIADYLFNVTVSDPNYVRDNITFNIELPENATGNVSVIIFGKEYLGKIKDGNATVNITAPYYGTFPYRVSFEEEGKYSLKTQTGSVVISKLSVDLNPDYPTPVYVGENVTFKVQLPKDATGNITVITRMSTYTVKLVNGSANVTVPAYPLAQNYSPSISYSGDDRYFANTTTLNIVVIKVSDYNLTVNVSDIHVGQTEIVNITLPSDATDDVLIYGNFSTDRFSKEIIKGKVSFGIANLKAGTYNITVLYQGYNKYESKNVTKTFTVGKVNSTIAIELVNGSKIVVSVPDNAVGEVEISIDTIKENVTIQNGKAILDVSNVDPGEYLVNASFAGDENYFGNKTSKTVVIPKITDYLINVTVEDIIVGENATVIVRLPGDINGFANITVNNVPYNNVEVKNGIAKLNVTKLAVGKYDASVNFTNSKYAFKTNSTEFEVFKIKTVLSTSISVENQTATITVRITENATGNITVYIDSKPYQRVIENNQVQVTVDLMPGDHIVQSHYDGDTNHSSADTSLYVIEIEKIKDYDLKINLTELITVIENNTITVTFPEKAYGRITIYVNEDFYNAEINTTTHNATVTLPYLKEGVYNVSVSYSNELYDYMSNRSSFRVIKLNTTIDVDVENITKDLTEVINITLNENVTGDVLIDVNGTVYHRTLENGKVNLTLTNLDDGNYTVIVTYEGSDFFNVNSTSVNFTVSKIPVEITVNASDIVVGHVLNIKFNMSREITDLVTVQVGKTNYTSFVYKGNGSLDVYDLPIGDYDITVYYAGDKDYLASSNKTSISVTGKKSSKMNVTVADITVGDDISVYINTTEPINGPVYVTIAGLAYTRELVNGEVTFKVSNLTARDYTISAFFMGDDDYELCNATSNFTVHKKNTNIVLDVDDINIGKYEIVNVTVNENATGYVLISIGTIHVYANITDGVASAVIRNLAVGKYNVTVEYIGDDNFNGNSTKGSFVVSQLKTDITINGTDIYVGQSVTFNVTTSANITEVVIVNVAKTGDVVGQNYTTFIENGKGNYTIYDLPAGDYIVTVYFPGNTQYAAVNNTTTIKVNAKKVSQVTVKVDNITVGEDAVIFVNVTDGATGSVTIIVAGDYYTKELDNSRANFTISGLIARDYHVSAVYLGDDYYLMGEGTANFTVNKKDTEIDFEVSNIDIGQYEIINVTVNKNATGYVLISIGTIHVYANITDGAASAVIRNLAVGKYNVTVMYMGDDYFNTNSTNKSFTVSQLKTDITINGTDIYVGQSVTFNVTTSANITEVVIINVAKVSDAVGQNYTTFIENGKGNYTVYDLPEGEYIVTVYFPGNTQYAAVNNTTTIKVNAKKVSEVTVKVDDITVDEDAVIFVNVTDGATGTVTIIVAGDYYTKELNNSKANFTVSGLIARDYHVSAVYLGDDYYLMGEGTANFTVHKKVTSINATAKDINVSEIETIKVNITQGVTGVVLIDINGTKYYANLTDSKVSLDISNLAVGRYDVTVTYLGDDKYHSNETKATFTVSKLDPEISISLHKILFAHGEDVIVYLTGPSDVTGVVTVTVGNIYGNDTHTAYINNGAGTLIIKNLDVDSYNVSAFYHENYKYIGKNTTKIAFEVYHNGTNISVTAHNIHVGQKETIMVTFPEGKFEGNVTIYVDGNPHNATIVYNATTNMSKVILTLDDDFAAGTYDVQVTYVHETEGKKVLYEGSNEFTVSKIESIIKINPIADIKFGENTTVVMKLNHDDATGEIHVYVDGKLHIVDATNPVLELDNLRRDYYYIQAFYMGDDKYLPSEAEVEFNVTKATPSMNIIIANDTYDVGSDVEINVTINKTATGYINLIVDGAENLLEINNGIVSYTLVNATPGNHTIVAEYLGDNNYYKASAERNFTVGKYTPVVNIADIGIDEDTHEINLTVKVNDDATGTIFIILENGTTVGSGIIDKGVAVITLDRILDPDTYNIVANYTGDDNYMNMTASASFTVPDITNYVLPVSANNITYGEGVVTVIVILPDGAKRENLTVKVDGVVYNNYVVDGNAVKVTLPSLKAGDHVVDVTYADDGYYATKSNSTVFNIAQATSDVILEVNSIYYVDDDIVINVTRFNSTGAITVKINGKNYNLTGNNVSIPKGLPNGTYIVDVVLDGDENHTGSAKNATFAVNKLTPNVTVINVDRIIVGNDAVIKIVGSDDRDANLVVNVGGIDYAVNLTKGSASLTVKGLDIGNNPVTVTYLENDKYVETGANGWVNVVDKASSAVVIKVNDNYDVDDTVEITVKAVNSTGNLAVTINGKVYTPKDDKITIDKAVYGTYDIVAVLDGDDNYYGSSNNATFKVNKITKDISANNVTITVGEDAVITVKGPQDRTGQIIVEVGGEKYLKEMKDGVSEVTIKKLDAGEYPVGITYLENDKYLSTGTNASITVNSKADSSALMNVTVDVPVNSTNGTVTVELPENATGNVTVIIDGKEYTVTDLINGSAVIPIDNILPGNHTVEVIYSGDANYTGASNITDVNVDKLTDYGIKASSSDITEGQSETIDIELDIDVDGVVLVSVGDDGYYADVVGGKGSVVISGLTNGTYTAVVTYPGDDKYGAKSNCTTFTVRSKTDSSDLMNVSVDIPENSTSGTVTVELPEDATGNVTVIIDGKEYAVTDLINGSAVIPIDNILPGNHTVEVIYSGDGNYTGASNITDVNVDKLTDYGIKASSSDITEGETETIDIELDIDVDGVVLVSVGDNGYYADVVGGKGSVVISGLTNGTYTAVVTYPGDDKYGAKSNTTTFTVKSKTDSSDLMNVSVDIPENSTSGTVTVELPENATGNVTVIIDGKEYTVTNLTNGSAVIPIDGLTPGNHTVEVIYSGDGNYTGTSNITDVSVDKLTDYGIKASSSDITEGETETIDIVLDIDVDGVVLVTVGDNGYYANITGGKGSLDVKDLAAGKYTAIVTYPGDDKYAAKSNTTAFTVKAKDDPSVNVDVDEDNKVITVELPEDATGDVVVVIDGKNQTVPLKDGKAVVPIDDLSPGNHTVEVIYPGDGKYAPVDKYENITVPKESDYSIKATSKDITEGETETIDIVLDIDADGVVLVTVGDNGYYANLTGGKASVEIAGLTKGTYTAIVTYPGDDKYASKSNTTAFTVKAKDDPSVNVDVDEDNKVITVELPEDATGNVTVVIDGKNQTVPLKDGKAVVPIDDLAPGNHTVEVIYPGDDKYAPVDKYENISVPKVSDYDVKVDAEVKDDALIVSVDLPEDADGVVLIDVDGVGYYANITDGKANIKLDDIPVGEHNITVTYPGNDKYASRSNSTHVDYENDIIITAPEVIKYFSGKENFMVYVTDLKGNPLANESLSITINGITYNRTTKADGSAALPLRIHAGEFNVTVNYKGSDKFDPETVYSHVTVKPTIYADDVTKVFRNGTHYYGLFLDGEGNPLVNTQVMFNIHGVFYHRTTNETGWAKLNIFIEKGDYIITAYNLVTGEAKSNNIHVISQIVDNANVVKYYRNGTQFTARILADDGSSAGEGEKVSFNIHGMLYNRYTNSTGHVNLTINLQPGDYYMTTYYKECREGNTIKVLPVLSASDLNMKYKDGSKFVAHLLDGQGNPNPNKAVTFNVNGVIYHRVTDSNGDARLNINLEPGEYIITSSYDGSNISNKITIS